MSEERKDGTAVSVAEAETEAVAEAELKETHSAPSGQEVSTGNDTSLFALATAWHLL